MAKLRWQNLLTGIIKTAAGNIKILYFLCNLFALSSHPNIKTLDVDNQLRLKAGTDTSSHLVE